MHRTDIPGIYSRSKLSRASREDLGYAHLVHVEHPGWKASDPSAMLTDGPLTLTPRDIEVWALDFGAIISEDA